MIVVLGFFRSGTSALCRMLDYCGVSFGKGLIPPSKYNTLGYYENHLINELNQAMGHAFHMEQPVPRSDVLRTVKSLLDIRQPQAIKDPRICRLVPSYAEIIKDPVFVLIERDEDDCVKSFDDFTLNYYGMAHARALRAQYQEMAWTDTQDKKRVCVTYEDLLKDWRQVAEQINEITPLNIGEWGGIDRKMNHAVLR